MEYPKSNGLNSTNFWDRLRMELFLHSTQYLLPSLYNDRFYLKIEMHQSAILIVHKYHCYEIFSNILLFLVVWFGYICDIVAYDTYATGS